jgi:alkanesulfonate monooxygenase SsuD/methylene tetrahydromethanopterin reductase-like flavin-dependent oxidoreductase (luciferase family)
VTDEYIRAFKELWTSDDPHFEGKYVSFDNISFLPKPVQKPHPPILVGASGERVALGIVARHADMWNSFGPPALFRHKIAKLSEHCRRIGRDPDTIEKSVLVTGMFAPDQARQEVEDYVDAGVTHIIFSVEAAQDLGAIRAFARDVMPAFRT